MCIQYTRRIQKHIVHLLELKYANIKIFALQKSSLIFFEHLYIVYYHFINNRLLGNLQ